MTKQEVFTQITSEHKWYSGKFSCGHASMIKKRFNEGGLSDKWIACFFTVFGYEKQVEQWGKK